MVRRLCLGAVVLGVLLLQGGRVKAGLRWLGL
jgi:hypothetical protein